MKKSTKRAILILWAVFPAVCMGVMFAVGGILQILANLKSPDVMGMLLVGSFISCMVIYGMFISDTIELYKGKQ